MDSFAFLTGDRFSLPPSLAPVFLFDTLCPYVFTYFLFVYFLPPLRQADLDKNNALTFDEWVRLLAMNYSALLQPKAGKKLGA